MVSKTFDIKMKNLHQAVLEGISEVEIPRKLQNFESQL